MDTIISKYSAQAALSLGRPGALWPPVKLPVWAGPDVTHIYHTQLAQMHRRPHPDNMKTEMP